MTLFDAFLVVDWSAAAVPRTGKDSIWCAATTTSDRGAVTPGRRETELVNPSTRRAASRWIAGLLARWSGRRVLVGFDFSFGYPAGFAAAASFALGIPAWRATWDVLRDSVADDERNRNNRFEVAAGLNRRLGDGPGPFWGCPPSARRIELAPTKAPGFPHRGLTEYRSTELAMRRGGYRVFSGWQLLGAGSVGSQSLTGIPVVAELVDDPVLTARAEMWPFTTGLTADPTQGRADAVVFAEIWPGLVPVDPTAHAVRDAAQVLGLARHLARLDRRGGLGPLFAPALDPCTAEMVCAEEGWILGTPAHLY